MTFGTDNSPDVQPPVVRDLLAVIERHGWRVTGHTSDLCRETERRGTGREVVGGHRLELTFYCDGGALMPACTTDPETWPEMPPNGPGFYWCRPRAAPTESGIIEIVPIRIVQFDTAQQLFARFESYAGNIHIPVQALTGWRFRPGRITP